MSNPEMPDMIDEGEATWVDGHPDDGLLHEGLDDELAQAESAHVAEHVSRCARCRSRVAEAHGFISSTRRIFKKMRYEAPPVELPVEAASAPAPVMAGDAPEAPAPRERVMVEMADEPAAAPRARVEVEPDAPVMAAAAPAAQPAPAAPTPAQTRAVEPTPKAAPAVILPPPPSTVAKPKRSIPWTRIAQGATVVLLVAAAPFVYRALQNRVDEADSAAAPMPKHVAKAPVPTASVSTAADSAQPDSALPPKVATGVAEGALAPEPEVGATPAVNPGATPAEPSKPTLVGFDSLTLTRTNCVGQCDEYLLFISSTGEVRLEQHPRAGDTHAVGAVAGGPQLLKLTASVSKTLFEPKAVPLTGRSVCTVFDKKHVPVLRLMVARGTSRALHANSCRVSGGALLELGAQIDSLVGSGALMQQLERDAKR